MVETTFDILKFSERLKELMENSNYNTYSLAEAVFLTPGTISKYVNAKMEPKRNTIELLAKHFQVNPAWLMGYDVDKWLDGQAPKAKTIPFIKSANYADNEIDGYEVVSSSEEIDLSFLVQDNSMINARIFEGDIAYISKQSTVENGEIAAVVIDGAITLKRLYMMDNSIVLHSENPTIPDKVLSKKDKKDITILGKVTSVKFKVR
ncbi:putative prophage repressor [Desulforamulus reducens MI-1]|uniref:Putative prophage repressor n=1 Tax=Desulforamulus reducens (strain ATCC BAA-1160 / DSM 100696 / MI-1) TaxID=349161 RepID=A4J7T1_DESRM|nr:XRE family transcriptional regulator [Desulforamulus reducens]ABO51134.1 putative prophage repressor [Desulforamulus reducens MI-1]